MDFSKPLVVVESPTKAKTLKKFLPKNYTVVACNGHVRDLPKLTKDIPEKWKKEPWAKLGVDVEHGYKPLYLVPKDKTKIVSELVRLLKDRDYLLLATDEDREGESISWHLLQLLKPKVPFKRMVFHEITKEAILQSLEDTREIDNNLVKAQETRRVLDRLVGYTVSPVLWHKIAFGLSAGRVQSVALFLVVQRERERIAFKPAAYSSIAAALSKAKPFDARLAEWQGTRIATGKDFDETTGMLPPGKKLVVLTPEAADKVIADLQPRDFIVDNVEEKTQKRYPSPPFITSTLQQEANRKFGWGAKDTMRVAQDLYERGFITYMRTDSVNLSQEALSASRACISEKYGAEYLPAEPRKFKTRDNSAQEAHEAIRPAGREFPTAEAAKLAGREYQLYDLIWKRTVASQMSEAEQKRVSVQIRAGEALFTANGSELTFPGFLRAYVEGSDDPEAALEERDVHLPPMKVGDKVDLDQLTRDDHETKPPARYTEASLVQKMEKEGIGRPSTYASTISTIIGRGYVVKQGNQLVPTFTAFAVNALVEKNFPDLVNLSFTSEMEKSLDEIAGGRLENIPYLDKFYKGGTGLVSQVESAEKQIDVKDARTVHLQQDLGFEVKIGKFGPYFIKDVGDGDPIHGSIPETLGPGDLTVASAREMVESSKNGPQSVGEDPVTKKKVYVLTGRFGPYVQLGLPQEETVLADPSGEGAPPPVGEEPVVEGAPVKGKKGAKKTGSKAPLGADKPAKAKKTKKPPKPKIIKPKIVGLPKGMTPVQVTLPIALKLLELPRLLGVHPDNGKEIKAGLGRFGPYIVNDKDFRSLRKEDDVLTVQLPRALELLAMPKGAGRNSKKVVKDVGALPNGDKVELIEGKYGLYVSDGARNASLQQGQTAEELTLAAAIELLNSRPAAKKKKKR